MVGGHLFGVFKKEIERRIEFSGVGGVCKGFFGDIVVDEFEKGEWK